MSLGGEDLRKTEELPGAFPSEDAITKSELSNTTSSSTPAGTQQHTKPYAEHDLGAHQNAARVGGANNSGNPSQTQHIAHAAAGSGPTATPADSDPDHLLRRAGAEGVPAAASGSRATPSSSTQGLGSNTSGDSVLGNAAGAAAGRGSSSTAQPSSLATSANPLSGPAVAADDGFGSENAPNITEDLKAVGSGAATAATAAAIAARDAAIAVKDAAAPVVGAASEQVGTPAYLYTFMVI